MPDINDYSDIDFPTLVESLLTSKRAFGVLRTLSEFKEDSLSDLLITCIGDPRIAVRAAACHAVLAWGLPVESASIVAHDLLSAEGDDELRVFGAAGLAYKQESLAIKSLRELSEERVLGITELALDTLCVIGHEDTRKQMKEELRDYDTAYFAAGALARVGDTRARLPLKMFLEDDSATFEKVRALQAIAYIPDEESIALIEQHCDHKDAAVKRAAFIGRARIGSWSDNSRRTWLVRAWSA